ncbi:MAG: UDP-N-acetylmuramoyl-L-alanine--D-glutamate ligase, partial [Actinomycetota bacterium]
MSRFADPGSTMLPDAGTRVLVLGLGISGEAAAGQLLRLGATVTVVDEADDAMLRDRAGSLGGATVVLGDRSAGAELAAATDLVLASPGVPEHAPALAAAHDAGVPVWSEVELGFRLCTAPVV